MANHYKRGLNDGFKLKTPDKDGDDSLIKTKVDVASEAIINASRKECNNDDG